MVIDMHPHLKVVRNQRQRTAAKINEMLGKLHSLNTENDLVGFAFVAIPRNHEENFIVDFVAEEVRHELLDLIQILADNVESEE